MKDIQMEISQPTDSDGFALLKCSYCGEYFKLKPKDVESDQVLYIWCPSCGLINDSYITDEVLELALNMIENKAMELIYSEFKKMSKRYNTKHLSFKVGKKPKEKPETPIMSRIDELEIQKYKCCNTKAKIKPLIKYTMTYCPICGVNYYEYK